MPPLHKRRRFVRAALGACLVAGAVPALAGADADSAPWPATDLMQPAELARVLAGEPAAVTIFSVAFPVLYRQRHILGAKFAGPGGKLEALASLRAAASALPNNSRIVLYCGCCPMEKCPNIRPAYRALKDAGIRNVRVLNLPTNLHTDWVEKGYPVEPARAAAGGL